MAAGGRGTGLALREVDSPAWDELRGMMVEVGGSAALAELGVPRGAMAGAVGSAALAEAGAPRGATAEPAGAAALTVAGSGCERPDAARPYVPSLWYACLH